jgi:zinc protease
MLSRRWLPIVLVAALLCTAAFAATELPAGVEKVTSVEGITEYRLANGLRVLLFPDPSKDTATVNITYLVGSRHEGYGESGMAHLLEHMVFKGTPKHKDIPNELTTHGCRPNGSTDYDRTNYFETFAATEENLNWALDLEADRMVNSYIAKKDLESEFTVVRNEFEIGENSPESVMQERMMSSAYLWHNYGKSTIGSRADIERVPIENLQAFYRTWYQPDNAVLIVAGNIDEAKTIGKIAAGFGKIPKPTRVLSMTYTTEPAQDGERTVTLRRVGDTQAVAVLYHVPSGPNPDFAAVELLSFVLGDTPSGRLYKALVETKKAAGVYGFAFALHDPGVVMFGAQVRTEASLTDARDALIKSAEGLAANPPTAAEVTRARDNWIKDWETGMRDSGRAAIGLSEWAAQGDWRLVFLIRDRVKAVTAEDVLRVAQAYLKAGNRTVGEFVPTKAPERAEIPATPELAVMLKDYKGGAALAAGEAFDPSPAAIEARTTRTTIPPGIKVVLLPKKTRGGTVQVAMTFHFGDEKSLQGRGPAAGLAGQMLMRGTANRTRQQIQDESDRLKAQLGVFGGATAASASIEVTRENLAPALELAAEILKEPSFPPAEYDVLRQETLAGLEDQKSDPRQKASVRLDKYLNPWPKEDPRYVESPDESIDLVKAIALDAVKATYADFYGASVAEIAIVGDFDKTEVLAQLTKLFGGWKSPKPYARLVDVYKDLPSINEKIEAPDKESAVFIAGLRLPLKDDNPDYPALVLGNFMTGGGFLNSRLATRIRVKDGLSYGVSSFLSASPFDVSGRFGSFAIYAPQNSAKLVTAFNEEIAKILDKGFTDEEIGEAKKGWLQSRKVSRSNDRELARTLAGREYLGRTLAWDESLESRVAALTNAQILAAMKKFIDPSKISMVQAGDFKKAATP